jgi:hypothetical protein
MEAEDGTVTSRSELCETLKKESKYIDSELKIFIARYVLPPRKAWGKNYKDIHIKHETGL